MRLVSIEGNIGAGKSTVVYGLKQRIDNGFPSRRDKRFVTLLEEPIDTWGSSLSAFYGNRKKYAFLFQIEIVRSRLQQFLEFFNETYDCRNKDSTQSNENKENTQSNENNESN